MIAIDHIKIPPPVYLGILCQNVKMHLESYMPYVACGRGGVIKKNPREIFAPPPLPDKIPRLRACSKLCSSSQCGAFYVYHPCMKHQAIVRQIICITCYSTITI